MKPFIFFSLLSCFSALQLQAQVSEDVWTGWLYGVEYWQEADSCNITNFCDDGDSLTYDYCDGNSCYHTYTLGSSKVDYPYFDIASDGSIWAGPLGLNHFNGSSWKNYLNKLSPLASNSITDIAVDKNDVVWIAFHQENIQSFDGQNWQSHNPTSSNVADAEMLYVDYQNRLWVSYHADGLYVYDGISWTKIIAPNLLLGSVKDICVLPSGEIWALKHNSGILYFDGQSWSTNPGDDSNVNLHTALNVAVDSTGIVYVGTNRSILKYEDTTWIDISPFPNTLSSALAVSPDNTLWVNRSRVSSYKDSVWRHYHEFLVYNTSTYDFKFGDDSTVYISYQEGIKYLNTALDTFLLIDHQKGFKTRDVDQILVRDFGEIWAVGGEGLTIIDSLKWHYLLDDNDTIMGPHWLSDIKEDWDGNIWIAARDGVIKFDGNQWEIFDNFNGVPFNFVYHLAIDSEQRVWFVTNNNQLYSIQDTVLYNHPLWGTPLAVQNISKITIDPNDRLWFSIEDHLVSWDQQNWELIPVDDPLGIGVNNTLPLFDIDPFGNAWTHQNNYLLKYDGQQWIRFNLSNVGSISQPIRIRRLKADKKGDIWINDYQNRTFRFDGVNLHTIPQYPTHDYAVPFYFDRFNRAYFEIGQAGGFLRYGPRETAPLYIIKGQVYHDQNENSLKDNLEPPLKYQLIRLLPDSSIRITNQDGYFQSVVDSGNYQIQYLPPDYLSQSSIPQIIDITVDSLYPQNDPILIGAHYAWDSADYRVSIMGDLNPRCSEEQEIQLRVTNVGKAFYSAQLHLKLDTALNFVSAQPAPDSISFPNLMWQIDSIEAGQLLDFKLKLVSPGVLSNVDSLFSYASITPLAPDFVPANNLDTLTQLLLCAYDPNDKQSFPLTESAEGYIDPQQTLEYRIRFQNTGNTYAENITILDTLPAELDLSSFQLLGSSHTMQLSITEQATLQFFFPGIKLPDSTTNEAESHGFVQFKIKPRPNLARFTPIRNRAAIYFDFNPPIYTDFVLNTIGPAPALSIEDNLPEASFQVIPNPFAERLSISLLGQARGSFGLVVYNMMGQQIYQQPNRGQGSHQIDTKSWEAGIYIIAVKTDTEISYQKVIKP